MSFVQNVKNWPFLQEPLYRWFIMIGALLFIFMAWGVILGYVKGAVD
jgi:hypothetical protein